MSEFAKDYLVFIFMAAFGLLLAVTAYRRLTGLLLMGRRLSLTVGAALVATAFTWFFTSAPRNLPDTGEGLDGNEQAVLFVAGACAALTLVLVLSSLRNWAMVANTAEEGIEALRHASYLHLLRKGLSQRWNYWYARMKERSSG